MKKNDDKIIEEIQEYIDNGKTYAEILKLHPEYAEELKDVISTINLLKAEGNLVSPPKESFRQVMEKIGVDKIVTNETGNRYTYVKEVNGGRPSWSEINSIAKIYNQMTMNWKIWAPVGIAVVIALVVVGNNQIKTNTSQDPIAGNQTETPVAIKPATGNIDDAVSAILAGASDDQAIFADALKDADLVSADGQAISNFGQSYNGNEF